MATPSDQDQENPSQGQEPGKKPFVLKEMGQEYIDHEKNAEASTVIIDDEEVSVRQKEWQRQQVNNSRIGTDKPQLSPEEWKAHDEAETTQYLNESQAERRRVEFSPAKDATGAANVVLTQQGWANDPDDLQELAEDKQHIFVMDKDGELFAQNMESAVDKDDDEFRNSRVHHSSFTAGEAVAGAGELKVDKQGVLKEISDRSGHYKPGEEQTKQTLEHLEQAKGVNLNNVKFTLDRGAKPEEKIGGMAKEFLQGQVTPEEALHRASKGLDQVEGAMEQTFKARHAVAEAIKQKGAENPKLETWDREAEERLERFPAAEVKAAALEAAKNQPQAAPKVPKIEGGNDLGIASDGYQEDDPAQAQAAPQVAAAAKAEPKVETKVAQQAPKAKVGDLGVASDGYQDASVAPPQVAPKVEPKVEAAKVTPPAPKVEPPNDLGAGSDGYQEAAIGPPKVEAGKVSPQAPKVTGGNDLGIGGNGYVANDVVAAKLAQKPKGAGKDDLGIGADGYVSNDAVAAKLAQKPKGAGDDDLGIGADGYVSNDAVAAKLAQKPKGAGDDDLGIGADGYVSNDAVAAKLADSAAKHTASVRESLGSAVSSVARSASLGLGNDSDQGHGVEGQEPKHQSLRDALGKTGAPKPAAGTEQTNRPKIGSHRG